jgi:hypothetical protein
MEGSTSQLTAQKNPEIVIFTCQVMPANQADQAALLWISSAGF